MRSEPVVKLAGNVITSCVIIEDCYLTSKSGLSIAQLVVLMTNYYTETEKRWIILSASKDVNIF